MTNHKNAVSVRNHKHQLAFKELGVVPYEANEELVESDMPQLLDFDDTQMQLFTYQYKIACFKPIGVLVKKGSFTQKLTSKTFKHLLGLKDKMLVQVINYYHRGSNGNGWFIVAPVEGSLKGWLNRTRGSLMFEGNGIERAMSLTFRTMLIDIWRVLSKMSGQNIFPAKITLEDFFMTLLADGVPKIQMLLTEFCEVRRCLTIEEAWERSWSDIDEVITKCCEICGCELNAMSRKFLEFIKKCENIVQVTNYPDIWTQDEKACYMYHVISGSPFVKHVMRSKVNMDSALKWPNGPPLVIEQLLKLEINTYIEETAEGERRNLSRYKSTAYDYVKLCRDTHKHFDVLPGNIKSLLGGSREVLVCLMEDWDPDIWTKLYEAIGPVDHQ